MGAANELLLNGTEVNSEDKNGQTAIFYAAREGHKEMCELLLKFGANLNKQDKKKQTAYYWAKRHNKKDVLRIIINCVNIRLWNY